MAMTGKSVIKELSSNGPGRVGLGLLTLLCVTAIVVVFTYPRDFGSEHWGNPSRWVNNPRSVPPAWTAAFDGGRLFRHHAVALGKPTASEATGRAFIQRFDLPVSFAAAEPPSFVALSMRGFEFHARPPIISAVVIRPDGAEIALFRHVLSAARAGESLPTTRHTDEPYRVVLSGDGSAGEALARHFRTAYDVDLSSDQLRDDFEGWLFATIVDGERSPLAGDYTVRVELMTATEEDSVDTVEAVFGGSVFGLMGTDALGRDLAMGLLFGLPIALLIGLATSTVSTIIGTSLGLLSGYAGGRTDQVIQRAADIVANIPVLPLLIFLVFIGGSQLWLILLVLVAFSWPGLTIMVRTMVLQLRHGQEVEAAVSLGASRKRIIARHVFPHTASYIFAQLVFFAPAAVLAEAGLSFLGLGDPSIPTWGQILEHGFRTGAVFLGYWWWVIPPGLLIVLTAVTFMFLALGMESVVDPRLKGARR